MIAIWSCPDTAPYTLMSAHVKLVTRTALIDATMGVFPEFDDDTEILFVENEKVVAHLFFADLL